MKKTLSFLMAGAMALYITACGVLKPVDNTGEIQNNIPVDDSEFTLLPEENDPLPEGMAGGEIVFAVDNAGVEDSAANAAIWQGIQIFAQNFGFTAQNYTATEPGADAAQNALRQAAESGASLVVCKGDDMATALFALQGNYPSVSYLLLDAEPHSADYMSYTTQNGVHCVLFQEEQAGFLAGYAAVAEGYTELGYLGSKEMPSVVRYATGFMQGAEAAAEQSGLQVNIKTWYCGSEQSSDDISARMSGWYTDGTQLIFAGAGNLAQACLEASQETGGKVIAANWNQQELGTAVLTTAEKNYNIVIQNILYQFYADGGVWNNELAGQTARMGISDMAVGLPQQEWRFNLFKKDAYLTIYDRLRTSAIKVERYSDAGILPELNNVTVDVQN